MVVVPSLRSYTGPVEWKIIMVILSSITDPTDYKA
jgi:hypothetical protein